MTANKFDNFKPLRDGIVVKRDETITQTESGIILKGSMEVKLYTGNVLAVGPKVEHVKVGDKIQWEKNVGQWISEKDMLAYIPEKGVIGIYEKD